MIKDGDEQVLKNDERALLLLGGSSRGVTQVSILETINRNEPDVEYSFIGGNSVGAINCAGLSQYKIGELDKGIKALKDLWFGIKGNKDIWRGGLWAIFRPLWKNGFADVTPLQKILKENYNADKARNSGRLFYISTVDLVSGEPVSFNQEWITWQHIYGSAAMPFAFPSIDVGDYCLTDGGVLVNGPLSEAISLGYKKIDIVMNYPVDKKKRVSVVPRKKVQRMDKYALRILDLILDQSMVQEFKLCLAYNKLAHAGLDGRNEVDVRIFAPEDILAEETILMDFSEKTINDWYRYGMGVKPIGLDEFLQKIG